MNPHQDFRPYIKIYRKTAKILPFLDYEGIVVEILDCHPLLSVKQCNRQLKYN